MGIGGGILEGRKRTGPFSGFDSGAEELRLGESLWSVRRKCHR